MNNDKRLLLVPIVFGVIMIAAGIFISVSLDQQTSTAPEDTAAAEDVTVPGTTTADTDTNDPVREITEDDLDDEPSDPIGSTTPQIDDERPEDIPRYECTDIMAIWDYPGFDPQGGPTQEFPWQNAITSGAPDQTNADGFPVYSPRCGLRSVPGQNPGPWLFRIYRGDPTEPDNYLTTTPTQNAYVLPEVTTPPSDGEYYTAACVEVQDIDLDQSGLGPAPSSDLTVRQVCIMGKILPPEVPEPAPAPPPPALPRTSIEGEDLPVVAGVLLIVAGAGLFIRYKLL